MIIPFGTFVRSELVTQSYLEQVVCAIAVAILGYGAAPSSMFRAVARTGAMAGTAAR